MNRLMQKLSTYPLKRVLPYGLYGAILGSALVYFSTGKFDIISFLLIAVFPLIIFVFIACFSIVSEDRKNGETRFAVFIDILSFAALGIFLACPWWMYLSKMPSHVNPGEPFPVQLRVFFFSAVPAFFGFLWLTFKYLWGVEREKMPLFFRWKMPIVILIILIMIPLLMMRSD